MALKRALSTDICIIGSGIMGLSIARQLSLSYPKIKITILEKEPQVGIHTSGRNSGVLHSGLYYKTDSFKQLFCKEGNHLWKQYIQEKQLDIKNIGKLMVCRNETEYKQLEKIFDQGKKNQVDISIIDFLQAKEIEPKLSENIYSKVLHVKDTAVINNLQCMDQIVQDLYQMNPNFQILYNIQINNIFINGLELRDNTILYKKLINCAGQQSLQIAQSQGVGEKYSVLPIKGLYLQSKKPEIFNTCVYPVPIEGAYFLGVHSTPQIDGRVKIGPTAFPALSLENYHLWHGMNFKDMKNIFKSTQVLLHRKNWPIMKEFFTKEILKVQKKKILKDMNEILNVDMQGYEWYEKPGIRAQLVDLEKKELVNDFLVEQQDEQIHLLNVVSPGWTCAFPMAKYIVDKMNL